MIDNAVIQADFVADIKAATAITNALGGTDEIREYQYQGADVGFPAIRVRVLRQEPIQDRENCEHSRLFASILAYGEGGSSKQSSVVAGLIAANYHRRRFMQSTWNSWLRVTGSIGPARITENIWRSEVLIEGTVYPIAAGAGWHD